MCEYDLLIITVRFGHLTGGKTDCTASTVDENTISSFGFTPKNDMQMIIQQFGIWPVLLISEFNEVEGKSFHHKTSAAECADGVSSERKFSNFDLHSKSWGNFIILTW